MAALRKIKVNGQTVEVWKTSYRVNDGNIVFLGREISDADVRAHMQKGKTMNVKTLAALLREDITTISVKLGSSEHTYLCTLELANSLVEGDRVLIEAAQALKTAKVVSVHEEPMIDPDDGLEYKWAFQRVDIEERDRQKAITEAVAERLQTHRKRARREQALVALGMTPDDVKALVQKVEP